MKEDMMLCVILRNAKRVRKRFILPLHQGIRGRVYTIKVLCKEERGVQNFPILDYMNYEWPLKLH